MHPTPTLVSVEEYLRTSFSDGDREYIDGHIVERNLGEKNHSKTQRELIYYFRTHQSSLKTFAFPEQRVQVKPTRFRVPDICVYIGSEPDEQVFHSPPFLGVEILSKDDRPGDVQEKIRDYTGFGVRFCWVIDPQSQRGYVYTANDSFEAKDGILRTEDPLCPASAGNGEQRSAVKLTEGTHEKNTKALHSPREGRHFETVSGGQGAGLEALRRTGAAADGVLPLAEGVL